MSVVHVDDHGHGHGGDAGHGGGPGHAAAPPKAGPVGLGAQPVLVVLTLLGLAGMGVSLLLWPQRAFSGLLAAAVTVLMVGLGGLVFALLMAVSNAGWATVLKRVPEALAAALPVGAVALLGVLPGAALLFGWVEHPHGRGAWLNLPFFAARMGGILLLWIGLAFLLTRSSRAQDRDAALRHTRRTVALSAIGLLLIAISGSVAAFDWLMSLETHWYSTMYGLYSLSGVLVAGVSAITIGVVLLSRRGRLPGVGGNHIHDLGKLMFAFSTLWAYLWLSQWLLIWYANLPEETTYYLARTSGGWSFLFWLNLVLNWGLPFVLLMPRAAKRSPEHTLRVAVLLLAARWLDVYLMVAPAGDATHPGISLPELSALLAVGACFGLAVLRALGRAPLTPPHDPYLGESQHHPG